MMLWTNDVLVDAPPRSTSGPASYSSEEKPHRSFGHDLVGQTWCRDLGDAAG